METDLLELMLVTGVVIIPALALSARIALRPIVDAIARLREAFATGAGPTAPDPRITLLEREVQGLRAEVDRLSETQAFYAQLQAPAEHRPRSEE